MKPSLVRLFVRSAPALMAMAAPTGALAEERATEPPAPELVNASLTAPTPPLRPAEGGGGATELVALQRRVAQLEEDTRSAERRAALAERQAAATVAESRRASLIGVDDKGFVLHSADNSFALKIKGLVAFDGRAYAGDSAASNGDSFLLRKIRPVFEATVLSWADLRFMPDFAGSKASVVDAFVDVRPTSWFKIRAGKFISPVGLERNEQDTEIAFIERSLTANLTAVRDIGVVGYLDLGGGLVHLAAGLVDGAADGASIDGDNNRSKDLVGRVWLQPSKAPGLGGLGALMLGVSGSSGRHVGTTSPDQTSLSPYVTPGQTTFFQYATSATDPTAVTHASGTVRRLNPEAFYYLGPVGLLGEYTITRQEVTRGASNASLTNRAWHGTANVVLGGRPTYAGVVDIDEFAPGRGHFGALELAVRVGQLFVDEATFPAFADPGKSAREALETGAGVSLYFSRNFKLSFDFERTTFQAAAAATGPLARRTENALLGRTQFLF